MRQVNVKDPNLAVILGTALVDIELVDERGRIVGHYKPTVTMADLEVAGVLPSDDELEQARNTSGRTYTTEEVITYLRSLK